MGFQTDISKLHQLDQEFNPSLKAGSRPKQPQVAICTIFKQFK
jgi:hypothetical protein